MSDDIVTRLRETGGLDASLHNQAADEIERLRKRRDDDIDEIRRLNRILRQRVSEFERWAAELDASGRTNTEPAALRGTPSAREASAAEEYLHTGASIQSEKQGR